MTCKARFFNNIAGLHMETWSGLGKDAGTPQLICAIDDNIDARHFVEVINVKTYSREVHVKGIIESKNGNAEFDASFLVNNYEWQRSGPVYGSAPVDTITLGHVQIKKKSTGQETLKVEVAYEDVWNLKRIKRADDPNNPLVFIIELV